MPEHAVPAYRALQDARDEYDPPCSQAPELWFSPDWSEQQVAREMCNTACPLRRECGTYALTAGEAFGVWGGMTAKQRARLTRTTTKNPTRMEPLTA